MVCRINRIVWILPFAALGCGGGASQDLPAAAVCGDGFVSGNEVCDISDSAPIGCAQYDDSKLWMPGGRAACAPDCLSFLVGTCQTEQNSIVDLCGNQKLDPGEVCDATIGAESCDLIDPAIIWEQGAMPRCADDCLSLEIGACKEKNHCGNGVLDDDEICDESFKSVSCEEFDPEKTWLPGGSASCRDCKTVEIGTCAQAPRCGDNIKNGGEACDAQDGVPESCADWDATRLWKPGGKPACSNDCAAIETGSCDAYDSEDIVFMNWNVLFEYDNHNGEDPSVCASVADRASKFASIINNYARKPDFISIAEASPAWHAQENTEIFRALGYEWAINEKSDGEDGREPLADVIYLSDKYNLIDAGFINLSKTDGTYVNRDKTIALYAALENKLSRLQYVILSTHWDANNIWNDADGNGPIVNAVGWVASHELNRINGARQSAELVANLREKYPKARIIYGGDLNTIDLDIIFGLSDDLRSAISAALSLYLNADISLADLPALIASINGILSQSEKKSFERLPDDFIGSHAEFETRSGLTDARSHALAAGLITAQDDGKSTGDPAIPDAVDAIGLPVVIDYAFYSADNLQLTSYKIMTQGDGEGNAAADYMFVSDHFPVKTSYLTAIE